MTNLDLSWMKNREWIEINDDLEYVPKEDAPEFVKEHYQIYLKQFKEAEKRGAV